MNHVLAEHLPFRILRRGKVRTLYEIDNERILIVASDNISAFDVVLPTPIPGKGIILTRISNFWFRKLSSLIPNHIIDAQPERTLPLSESQRKQIEHRSVLARKLKIYPYECIVRGYISGSLWKAYCQGDALGGMYPPGTLIESDKLPEPIFTPTTKADSGHDIPVSFRELSDRVGKETAEKLRDISITMYKEACKHAQDAGIIIADTKFEFGTADGKLFIADELLTPDSSRFWPVEHYHPGGSQPSFDKQFVRDYLESINWDKTPPGPALPDWVVEKTREKYFDAYTRLTGAPLPSSINQESNNEG